MSFDEMIDRRGTRCTKWDEMHTHYGVPPDGALPMWVADMDFRPPQGVLDAVEAIWRHGVFGYGGDTAAYGRAVQWWMGHRHGWDVSTETVLITPGLVSAVGVALDAYTQPGDGVLLFTPVYHAFARVIRAAGRQVVECPLRIEDSLYVMDFPEADRLAEQVRMVISCSPHNPGGRVWSVDELSALGDLAKRHDLILLSDEVHHDLVFPGAAHVPMPLAAPDILDRLVMLTAPSKTFNIAGGQVGNVIIPDPTLRAAYLARLKAMAMSGNMIGLAMATAAYSPEGAAWCDALVAYLDANRQSFDAGMAAIPGLWSMPMQSTYLAWVDFSGTGLSPDAVIARVEQEAGIAASHGSTFGRGGETWLRFNLGTQSARVDEAISRLTRVFAGA